MVSLITDNLERIHELCREYHVKTLYVFGSATGEGIDGNTFGPESDVDLLVEFERKYVRDNPFDLFYLMEEFEKVFHRKVDMVEIPAMRNPFFIKAVEQQKQLIYAA